MATVLPDLEEALTGKTIMKTLFEPCRVILYFDNGDVIDLKAINKNDEMKMYTDLKVKTLLQEIEWNV